MHIDKLWFILSAIVTIVFCLAIIVDTFDTNFEVSTAFYTLMGIIFGGSTAQGFILSRRKNSNNNDKNKDIYS